MQWPVASDAFVRAAKYLKTFPTRTKSRNQRKNPLTPGFDQFYSNVRCGKPISLVKSPPPPPERIRKGAERGNTARSQQTPPNPRTATRVPAGDEHLLNAQAQIAPRMGGRSSPIDPREEPKQPTDPRTWRGSLGAIRPPRLVTAHPTRGTPRRRLQRRGDGVGDAGGGLMRGWHGTATVASLGAVIHRLPCCSWSGIFVAGVRCGASAWCFFLLLLFV
jgi:hypothetical protein